jgi:hypothetical protein
MARKFDVADYQGRRAAEADAAAERARRARRRAWRRQFPLWRRVADRLGLVELR